MSGARTPRAGLLVVRERAPNPHNPRLKLSQL